MSTDHKIFVAKHKVTGLFLTGLLAFFSDIQEWVKAKTPTDAKILDEREAYEVRKNRWVSDVNSAEIWNGLDIGQYGKFMPHVDFIEVHFVELQVSSKEI